MKHILKITGWSLLVFIVFVAVAYGIFAAVAGTINPSEWGVMENAFDIAVPLLFCTAIIGLFLIHIHDKIQKT